MSATIFTGAQALPAIAIGFVPLVVNWAWRLWTTQNIKGDGCNAHRSKAGDYKVAHNPFLRGHGLRFYRMQPDYVKP